MIQKFTELHLKGLKPKEKEYTEREKGGFGVRVMPSGRKVFFYLYRIDGQRRFLNLGEYPQITLKEARKEYERAESQIKLLKAGLPGGVDPVKLKMESSVAREESRKAPTVSDLATEYLDKYAKRFKKSWDQDESLLNRDVLPVWGKRKAEDISKRDVTLLLERIVDRGSPAMSNRVFRVVRKMFNFAVERDILKYSPCLGVKEQAPNNSCERVLSESEIKTLWTRLDYAAMSDEVKAALKLTLVTAQRPGEVVGMHSDEIDGRWWIIPAERAKNGRAHRVYLSDLALELIGGLEVIEHETVAIRPRGYIFASPKGKGNHINPHALSVAVRSNTVCEKRGKKLIKAEVNKLGVEQFTPHDLRRTAATFMAGMGFMDEIIDAVLNHVKQGVIRTYNRHDYDNEKKMSLEAWERKLNSIVTDNESKVASTQSEHRQSA